MQLFESFLGNNKIWVEDLKAKKPDYFKQMGRTLNEIKENSSLIIDASNTKFIDFDIRETLDNFVKTPADDNIAVQLYGFPQDYRLSANNVAANRHQQKETA